MIRLDQHAPPVTPADSLRHDVQTAIEALRKWAGVLPDPDTGERVLPRQKVPA
jgi:hypothetical protein